MSDRGAGSTSTTRPRPGRSRPGVLEAITDFFGHAGGNTGRAGHRRSIASSRAVSLARERLADLLGAETPDQLSSRRTRPRALNLAILGLVTPGSRVVTSSLEHNSVMRPLREPRAARHAAPLEVVPADGNTGETDLDEWAARLASRTAVRRGVHARLERDRRPPARGRDLAARGRSGRSARRRRVPERGALPADAVGARCGRGRDARPQGPARPDRHGPRSTSRRASRSSR